MSDKAEIGRLAMRREGKWWVAYYALSGTMVDAIKLGSIRLTIVTDAQRKERFMNIMRDAVGDIIEAKTGTRPTWGGPQSAPESERSGNA